MEMSDWLIVLVVIAFVLFLISKLVEKLPKRNKNKDIDGIETAWQNIDETESRFVRDKDMEIACQFLVGKKYSEDCQFMIQSVINGNGEGHYIIVMFSDEEEDGEELRHKFNSQLEAERVVSKLKEEWASKKIITKTVKIIEGD